MKTIPVKNKKVYEDLDGNLYEKKRQALKENIFQARAAAVAQLFIKYYTPEESVKISVDEYIRFIAGHGDEVIDVLTEEE